MHISRNRIIAYSLLAHINDNATGIADLGDVFIPLIKNVLSRLCSGGTFRGQVSDLKKEFDTIYALDIPYPLLTNLLKRVAEELNSKGESTLLCHSDNSFELSRFAFAEVEELCKQHEQDLRYVEQRYAKFIKAQGDSFVDHTALYEFLDRNRFELSEYFAHRRELPPSTAFGREARFVQALADDSRAFKTLRKTYLGSIIASYLSIEPSDMQVQTVELVADTGFVIGLLGLRSQESEHTCQTVLHLAQRSGYTFSILNITIKEIRALLQRQADQINTLSIMSSTHPESIEAACLRRGLGKSDLQRYAKNIRSILEKKFCFRVIELSKQFIIEAEQSEVYKWMMRRRHNIHGAPHDGIAYYYVRKQRGEDVTQFSDAKSWFVGSSRFFNSRPLERDGILNEAIEADYLVTILWLSGPRLDTERITRSGLMRLVASTIAKEFPRPSVLREIDDNIRKYSDEDISANDLAALATSTAHRTAENLHELDDAQKESQEALLARVQELAANATQEAEKKEREANDRIQALEKDIERAKTQTTEALSQKKAELAIAKQENINRLSKPIALLRKIRGNAEKEAQRDVRLAIIGAVSLLLLPPCTGYALALWFGWNQMEGWVTFAGFLPFAITVLYFAITKKSFRPTIFCQDLHKRRLSVRMRKIGFDYAQLERMECELDALLKPAPLPGTIQNSDSQPVPLAGICNPLRNE